MSYYGFDPNVARHCRGTPKIAKENLTSAGDFSSDTTHKVSIIVFQETDKLIPVSNSVLIIYLHSLFCMIKSSLVQQG